MMTHPGKIVVIGMCFKNKLKNADLMVGTRDIAVARRIARIWGEVNEGEPLTRTIFKGEVAPPSSAYDLIDKIKVWPPLF
jgi:hypothetical protein